MPVDLSPTGRLRRREAKVLAQSEEIKGLGDALEQAHDDLAAAHDTLHAIVDAKGRGGLKLAQKHLGLDQV